MLFYREIRRRFAKLVGPFVSACLVSYFSYHLIQGNHGLRAYWRLGDELIQAQQKLNTLQDQHNHLYHQVSLLRPDSICPDLLDEQVRKNLGYVNSQEIVILHNE